MATSPNTSRLFFALWPDAQTAGAIDAAAGAIVGEGRRVPRARLHMTLVFIGGVEQEQIMNLMVHADHVRVPEFVLQLDCIGYFRRPQIAWLGTSRPPQALAALADTLSKAADTSAHQPMFKPHVSLARQALPPPAADARVDLITWPVRSFRLVESGYKGAPGHYRCLRQWQLGQPV